jgi:acyl carrier protein
MVSYIIQIVREKTTTPAIDQSAVRRLIRDHITITVLDVGGVFKPMIAAQIRDEILDILSEIAPDEDLSNLDDVRSFREQLELDSMDFLDIVMELRKRHRIQIPEDEYSHLASMSSTVKYLEPKMAAM